MLFDFLNECGQWDDDGGIGDMDEILGLRFVRTCIACPEQYDVFHGDEQVGYVRLRHGSLTVECPYSGGEMVLRASPKGDGIFESDERDWYLHGAAIHIRTWMGRNGYVTSDSLTYFYDAVEVLRNEARKIRSVEDE